VSPRPLAFLLLETPSRTRRTQWVPGRRKDATEWSCPAGVEGAWVDALLSLSREDSLLLSRRKAHPLVTSEETTGQTQARRELGLPGRGEGRQQLAWTGRLHADSKPKRQGAQAERRTSLLGCLTALPSAAAEPQPVQLVKQAARPRGGHSEPFSTCPPTSTLKVTRLPQPADLPPTQLACAGLHALSASFFWASPRYSSRTRRVRRIE
jgi:hypothetical protein